MSDSEEDLEDIRNVWSWMPSFHPQANTLFVTLSGTPLTFFVHDDIISTQRLEKIILKFGGSLCCDSIETSTVILVRENFKPPAEWGPCYSRRFIRDCIEAFEILDLNHYLINNCVSPQVNTSLRYALMSQTVQFRSSQLLIPIYSKRSQSLSNLDTTRHDVMSETNTVETSLQNNFSSPEINRIESDTSLQNNISSPEMNRTDINTSLENNFSSPEINRIKSNTSLENNFSSPEINRIKSNTSLQNNFSTPEINRIKSNTSLQNNISSPEVERIKIITNLQNKVSSPEINRVESDDCAVHQAFNHGSAESLQATAYCGMQEQKINESKVHNAVNKNPNAIIEENLELGSHSELLPSLTINTEPNKPQKLTLVYQKNISQTIYGYFSSCNTKFFVVDNDNLSDQQIIPALEKIKSNKIATESKEFLGSESGNKKQENEVSKSPFESTRVKRCSCGKDREINADVGVTIETAIGGNKETSENTCVDRKTKSVHSTRNSREENGCPNVEKECLSEHSVSGASDLSGDGNRRTRLKVLSQSLRDASGVKSDSKDQTSYPKASTSGKRSASPEKSGSEELISAQRKRDEEQVGIENKDCSLLVPFFGIKKKPKKGIVAPMVTSNLVRPSAHSTPQPLVSDKQEEPSLNISRLFKQPSESEDSDDELPNLRNWPNISKHSIPDKHTKQRYSRQEKVAIVLYIVNKKAFGRLKSDALYREMEAKNICPRRTYQSMKNHFLKTIIHELHTFSFLSDRAKNKLRGEI